MTAPVSTGASAIRGEVAIVGVACTYPGARRAEVFWQNVVAKVDAITDVDPSNWDPATFLDPDPSAEDRLYTAKGGWIPNKFSFNPLKFGIPPSAITGAEPDHFLLLRCVFEALEDAGYMKRDFNRERTSVIVGKGNYVGPGQIWLTMRSSVMEGVIRLMREMRPDLSEAKLQRLREMLKAKLPKLTAEGAGGIIPNISTGRVANRFDFMGQNFSVDAACASTLIAAEIAVRNLLTGVDDMSLIGGLHISNQVPFLSIFKVSRALSLSSVVRPFDENADGTITGEGVGMLVLKRLSDAERDGDRIYAVIKGVGTASDGKAKAVMAPRVEGETLAIRRALEMAEVSPETVELIECHGTATTVGDAVEIEALETAYGPADSRGPVCAIGSVKSMIGHTMPAAGAASLIKTALALYDRVLPPSLNVTKPHPMLRDPDCRFYVNSETRPWIHRTDGTPRRAAVSAFGFGGINVHLIMEEYTKAKQAELPTHLRDWECEVVVVEGASRDELLAALDRLHAYATKVEGVALRDVAYSLNTSLTGARHRVSIVASSLPELAQKIERVQQRLVKPDCVQIRDRGGLYFFDGPELRGGKLALLFPGEGAQYLNMMTDLCIQFPEVRQSLDEGETAVKKPGRLPLSTLIYPPSPFSEEEETAVERRLWTLEHGTETVLAADWAMLALVEKLGIKADMMTGHSVGEWLAMAASGMVDSQEFLGSMDRLDAIVRNMERTMDIPKMAMLAVGAGVGKIQEMARQVGCEVEIANDNCPHQVVAVVKPEACGAFMDHLLKSGVFVERLPYDGGYHTPSFTYIGEPLRALFGDLKIQSAKLPVYCCMTTGLWPEDPAEILNVVADTFARPILFTETIQKMYDDGARIFLEAGPRGNLTAFVDDILRGKPHLAVPLDLFRRPSLTALNHAMGMLAAAHVAVDFGPLYARRSPVNLTLDATKDSVLPEEKQPGVIQVSKCYTFLEPIEGTEFPMPAGEPGASTAATTAAPAESKVVPEPRPAAPTPIPVSHEPAQETPAEFVFESVAPSAYSAPVYPLSAELASAPSLEGHFALMEEFLQTEEEVMRGLLGSGSLAAPASDFSAFAPLVPSPIFEPPVLEQAWSPQAAPVIPAAPVILDPPQLAAAPAPAEVAPVPVPASAPAVDVQAMLLKIVADRTGYPEEILGLDQDMEADLGIDSIKRVEIFGALRELSGDNALSGEGDMEAIAKLKTLREVLAFLGQTAVAATPAPTVKAVPAPALPAAVPAAALTAGESIRSLLGGAAVLQQTPGESITLRVTLDLAEHRYLRDHYIYFPATEHNNQGDLITVVPLTCSLELLCEAAALIDPSAKVVGARNIEIFRPLQVVENEAPPVVQLVAARYAEGEVKASVRDDKTGSVFSQMIIRTARAFPAAPVLEDFAFEKARTPECPSGQKIYELGHMFHGPSFQGIDRLEVMANNGLQAKLAILPNTGCIHSVPSPQFYLDPFLLDAAGQLVGYWPVENTDQGYIMLPIKVAEVVKYCDAPPAGTLINARLYVRNVSQRTLRADYDLLLPDGRLWLRVTGWEDWRFYWPKRMLDFGRKTLNSLASDPVESPALEAGGYDCVLMQPMSDHERDPVLDENWSMTLLSRREVPEFKKLNPKQKTERLFAWTTAKDAARYWIAKRHGRKLYPADIELDPRPDGSAAVTGFWTAEVPAPQISISYQNGWAAAVAGPEKSTLAVVAPGEAVPEDCFLPDELDWLNRLPDPDDWKRRAVAAKKAAARYLAPASAEDCWQTLNIVKIDKHSGLIGIADPGSAVNAEDALRAATARYEEYTIAVVMQP